MKTVVENSKSRLHCRLRRQFLDGLIEEGGNVYAASLRTGVSVSEYRAWITENTSYSKAFEAAVKRGQQRQFQSVFNKACQLVREGNRSMLECMRRNYGDEVVTRIQNGETPTLVR